MPNPAPPVALPPSTRPTDSASRPLLERGLDSSSGLGFVRERLALVAKTLFLVSFGFYVALTISMTLIGGAPFVAVVTMPVAVGHLCASSTMGLVWLVAGRVRARLGTLAVSLLSGWSTERAQEWWARIGRGRGRAAGGTCAAVA